MENNRLARAISASSAPPSTSCATFAAIQPSAMLDRISNAISQWNVFVTLPYVVAELVSGIAMILV